MHNVTEGGAMTQRKRNSRRISLATIAANINRLDRASLGNIFGIGKLLLEAKKQLDYGQWGHWLDKEFGWSADTADRYMASATLAATFRTVRNLKLPLTVIYALAKLDDATTQKKAIAKLQAAIKSAGRVTAEYGQDIVARCSRQSKNLITGTTTIKSTRYKVPVYSHTAPSPLIVSVVEAEPAPPQMTFSVVKTEPPDKDLAQWAAKVVPLHQSPSISPPEQGFEFRHKPGSTNAWVEDFDSAVRSLDQLRSKSLTTFDDTRITPDTIKSVVEFLDAVATRKSGALGEQVAKAHPFTADDECEYTTMVKQRKLYEGACELRWKDYFAYRDANTCRALTEDDLLYLGQWTVCPT
jgi:hypothetical protein